MLAARQALHQNQPVKAFELINPIKDVPDQAVRNTYAEVLYLNGRIIEAINVWEELHDTYYLEKAAKDLSAKGDYEKSLQANQALYRFDPEKFTSSLAISLQKNNRFEEAADVIIHARRTYIGSTHSLYWLRYLASIYLDEQNWQAAEQTYIRIVTEFPEDDAWKNLGLLYLRMNEPEKAVDSFNQMLSITHTNVSVYYLLAQAYERAGRIDEAIQTFQKVLTFSPEDPTALEGIDRLSAPGQTNP